MDLCTLLESIPLVLCILMFRSRISPVESIILDATQNCHGHAEVLRMEEIKYSIGQESGHFVFGLKKYCFFTRKSPSPKASVWKTQLLKLTEVDMQRLVLFPESYLGAMCMTFFLPLLSFSFGKFPLVIELNEPYNTLIPRNEIKQNLRSRSFKLLQLHKINIKRAK